MGAQAQQKSVLNIDDNDEFSSFESLTKSSLQNYRLFFTGEDHRFRNSNSQLELKMFKYLHKTAGVRVLLVEFGEGLGYIINKYVQEGDSDSYQILKKFLYEEYFDQVEGLRSFYTSLGDDEKFSVRGIDIERSPLFAVKKLEMLLPDRSTAHDSILVTVDAIKALSEFYDNNRKRNDFFDDEDEDNIYADTNYLPNKTKLNAWRSLKLVLANFEKHKEKYTSFLGNDFDVFQATINNIAEYYYWDDLEGTAQLWLFRESRMEKILQALFAEGDGIKAYGQFGRCHTQRSREKAECPYYYFNSLATRINTGSNPQLAGKVFSCAIFYPQMYDFEDDQNPINDGIKDLIKTADKDELTLYILDSAAKVDASLLQRFNAVIINNLKNDKTRNNDDPEFVYGTDYLGTRFCFLADGGFSGYDFKNLNSALGTNFNNQPQFFGFSIVASENRDFSVKTSFLAFSQVDKKINDSLSFSLKGYRLSQYYGGDIIKSNRIDLVPSFGLGYEWWIMDSEEKFTDEARKDVFGKNRITRYKNPAFFVGTSLDLRIHIDWITLGFFANYQVDLSKQSWRRNGEIIGGTPRQSLSAYTIGASIGVNFID